ncbi:histidine phosphatase family protein [Bilifractor porci]|jgi:alpha-ribazole phosphatase|uniref:Histidine phosphatase family protein n=1 Tax=Bilifractor porci TaxID=2606636 RepID=A0A7X2P5Z8_9FIRM|nr:histidine phosphatase family protein [Bilifractor porci]MST80834.1 histidine phosphatase family protein [Bilifractor porci]
MDGWLIRHGATFGNTRQRYIGTTDEPLTEEENTSLPEVAEKWKKGGRIPETAEAVFVSPLLRCRQTAALFYPDAEQKVIRDLRECDFGDFENKNYRELAGNPDYQRWIDSGGTLPFPNGEDAGEFRNRCRNAFLAVLQAAKKQDTQEVLFFVHGGTIMSILEAFGVPVRSYYDWHVKNGEGWHFSAGKNFSSNEKISLRIKDQLLRG